MALSCTPSRSNHLFHRPNRPSSCSLHLQRPLDSQRLRISRPRRQSDWFYFRPRTRPSELSTALHGVRPDQTRPANLTNPRCFQTETQHQLLARPVQPRERMPQAPLQGLLLGAYWIARLVLVSRSSQGHDHWLPGDSSDESALFGFNAIHVLSPRTSHIRISSTRPTVHEADPGTDQSS